MCIQRCTPVLCKSIQEVVRLEDHWEVIDLNHVTKLIRIDADTHALIHRVVIVSVLNGDGHCLLQVGLDLRGQRENKQS